MTRWIRIVVALLVGLVVGGSINTALIVMSPSLIPPPPGVDVNDAASLAAGIHLFQPRHFVMPFLAHAMGTLAGALVAFLLAGSQRAALAWAVGVVFLGGGIAASVMIPAPDSSKSASRHSGIADHPELPSGRRRLVRLRE